MLCMGIWDTLNSEKPVQVGAGFWGFKRVDLSLNPEQCCFVEAIPGLSLDPTSILGVYKVF